MEKDDIIRIDVFQAEKNCIVVRAKSTLKSVCSLKEYLCMYMQSQQIGRGQRTDV